MRFDVSKQITLRAPEHVAVVLQSHYLLPMLTAQDNVELPLLLTKVD